MRQDKHEASTNVCKVVLKQGVELELLFSKFLKSMNNNCDSALNDIN